MTREKAINRLRDIINEISDYCNASKRMSEADRQDMETFDMAIKALEQEPRWIPVSERLPKTFEFVNCTCHSLIDDREDWVVETVYIPQPLDSPYSDWGNIPMLNDGNCEVVAWMHRDIPQPYNAESEEEICR